MARSFAGALGSLAFATVLAHGALHSAGLEGTIGRAAGWMIVFAIVGAVVGRIAQSTVEESVRARMADELAARTAEKPAQ